jgi:glycine hydroxymethyltransferase
MSDHLHSHALINSWSKRLKSQNALQKPRDWLFKLQDLHHNWRERDCLNLIAAEGPMSLEVRQMLASPLGSRTAAGHIGKKQRLFAGARYINEIEALCHATLQELFACNFIEHRVLGGTQACQVVQTAMLCHGDTIISVAPDNGGDSSTHSQSILSPLGIKIIDMPFCADGLTIDYYAFEMLLLRHKIKMVSLGFSVCIKIPDFAKIINCCREHGVFCHVDCAHELGLIAGGCYPNPLTLGANVMTGSTGKTMSGPQGGIILWNEEKFSRGLIEHTFPFAVGGYQINRILALTMTAFELLEYGSDYMNRAINNAQTLAQSLINRGLYVHGVSTIPLQTHQVIVKSVLSSQHAIKRLESSNIIANEVVVPRSEISAANDKAIRLGVMELTRLGMTETDMKEVARLIADALQSDATTGELAHCVANTRRKFMTYYYCFNYPRPQ